MKDQIRHGKEVEENLHNRFMLDHADAHSRDASRSIFLANGAALIAAMGFVGTLADKSASAIPKLPILISFGSFGAGICFAILGSLTATHIWHHARGDRARTQKGQPINHRIMAKHFGMLLGASLICFAIGLTFAAVTLLKMEAAPSATTTAPPRSAAAPASADRSETAPPTTTRPVAPRA